MSPKIQARFVKALSTLPVLYWGYFILWGDLGADPAKTLNHKTGEVALYLLLFNLVIGAVLAIFKNRPSFLRALVLSRRFLGVWTFVILCGHVFLYYAYEGFEAKAVEQMLTKTYLIFGFSALMILCALTLTSNDFSVRRMGGKNWKRLHRYVHLAAFLVMGHVLLIEKADLAKFGALFAVLWLIQSTRVIRALVHRRRKTAA